MAGHIERKEVIYMLVLVGFVLGVVFFYKRQYFMNDAFHNMRSYNEMRVVNGKIVHPPKQSSTVDNYREKMEAVINNMLRSVSGQMQQYRQRRQILGDVFRPNNLQNPQYISESYNLALEAIEDLNQRSDRIVQIFTRTDHKISQLIQNRPAAAQQNIKQHWDKIKKEQVNLYTSYFKIEKDILNHYKQLITLYFQHQNNVIYDTENNQVGFKSENTNKKAMRLSKTIDALKKKQASLGK